MLIAPQSELPIRNKRILRQLCSVLNLGHVIFTNTGSGAIDAARIALIPIAQELSKLHSSVGCGLIRNRELLRIDAKQDAWDISHRETGKALGIQRGLMNIDSRGYLVGRIVGVGDRQVDYEMVLAMTQWVCAAPIGARTAAFCDVGEYGPPAGFIDYWSR